MRDKRNLRQVFADKFTKIANKDKKLVVVVGDISHGVFSKLREKNPDRYYNIGIHEQSMMSVSAGLSKSGLIPVVHTIGSFLIERSFEQIKLDFGYQNLPGNLISVGSAFDYSALGCTHHCYTDFMLLKTLPNSEIFYPGSPRELETQIQLTYNNNKLTLFRISANTHNYEFDYDRKNFRKVLKLNKGHKPTIVCTAPFVKSVLEIIEKNKLNDKIDLLYVNCVKPLDTKTIEKSIIKTKKVLLIEDHLEFGGIHEDMMKLVHKKQISEYYNINIPITFIRTYGSYEDILEKIGMDKKSIEKKIKKLI